MAYFIDEAGNRGLKAEGRRFFAWDFGARKFVSPVDDAPPKSRMRRCSEFEAKLFNFVSNHPGREEDFDRLQGRKRCEACADGANTERKK